MLQKVDLSVAFERANERIHDLSVALGARWGWQGPGLLTPQGHPEAREGTLIPSGPGITQQCLLYVISHYRHFSIHPSIHPNPIIGVFFDKYLLSEMPCGQCYEGKRCIFSAGGKRAALSQPCHSRGAVAGQGSTGQAWNGVWSSELEKKARQRVVLRHVWGQRAWPDDKVLLGPGASMWQCPHS